MNPRIHQIVAGFRDGDAISAEADALDSVFRAHCCESAIWCARRNTAIGTLDRVRDIAELPAAASPDDLALLHLSIGSPANDIFRALKCRKAIIYHNVTPARFFERCNTSFAKILEDGRRAVAALAGAADINLADSAFNAAELAEMGYENPRVFPLVIDTAFGDAVDAPTCAALAEGGVLNILFVGRVVPNKRHDRLLEIYSRLRALEPRSRLVIAGSASGNETYKVMLQSYAKELGLGVSAFGTLSQTRLASVSASVGGADFAPVVFTGFLKPAELNACYKTASAFLCMSDHEGFCAPLLEAMHWDVPVFADAQAAVPETLAGSGVLFDGANSAEIAETILRVVRDPALREAVLRCQRARLARFNARDIWAEISALLELS